MPEDASLDQFATADDSAGDESDDAEQEPRIESESDDAATEETPTAAAETEDAEVEAPETDPAETAESMADETEKTETDEGGSEASESEDASDESEVTPAVSTYDWSPEGGECADCGEPAEMRWRADGQRDGELVCPDCKDW